MSEALDNPVPDVDRWIQLGLHTRLRYLEPATGPGGLAVSLHSERVQANIDFFKQFGGGDWHMYSDDQERAELEQARLAVQAAEERCMVFSQVHFAIWGALAFDYRNDPEIHYEQAVAEACAAQINELSIINRTYNDKEELVRLVDEAGLLYRLEPDSIMIDFLPDTLKR